MAKKEKEQLDWINIDLSTLPASAVKSHAKVRKCFELTKLAKDELESELVKLIAKHVPLEDHQQYKFSYLRGIAVAKAKKAKAKVAAAGGLKLVG